MENNNDSGRCHHTDSDPANTDSIQMRNVVTEISANDSASHADSALSLLQMSRNTIMQGTTMGIDNAVCVCDDVTCQPHPQHVQGFNDQHKYNIREKSGKGAVNVRNITMEVRRVKLQSEFNRFDPTCLEPMNEQIYEFLAHVLKEKSITLIDLSNEEKMEEFKHEASNNWKEEKGFDFVKWSQYDIDEMLSIDTMTTAYLIVQEYFSDTFGDDNLMNWRSFSPENVVRNYVYYYINEVIDNEHIIEIRTKQLELERIQKSKLSVSVSHDPPSPADSQSIQQKRLDLEQRVKARALELGFEYPRKVSTPSAPEYNPYDDVKHCPQMPPERVELIKSRLSNNECICCAEKLTGNFITLGCLLNGDLTFLRYCVGCQNS